MLIRVSDLLDQFVLVLIRLIYCVLCISPPSVETSDHVNNRNRNGCARDDASDQPSTDDSVLCVWDARDRDWCFGARRQARTRAGRAAAVGSRREHTCTCMHEDRSQPSLLAAGRCTHAYTQAGTYGSTHQANMQAITYICMKHKLISTSVHTRVHSMYWSTSSQHMRVRTYTGGSSTMSASSSTCRYAMRTSISGSATFTSDNKISNRFIYSITMQ